MFQNERDLVMFQNEKKLIMFQNEKKLINHVSELKNFSLAKILRQVKDKTEIERNYLQTIYLINVDNSKNNVNRKQRKDVSKQFTKEDVQMASKHMKR